MLTEKFFFVILGPTVVTFRCDELCFVFDSVALFFSYRYPTPSHDFYLQLLLFTKSLFTKFYCKDKIADNKNHIIISFKKTFLFHLKIYKKITNS